MKGLYTWKPDLPDIRDLKYSADSVDNLPPRVDLRNVHPKIYNQLQLGACTANSISMAFDFERVKQGLALMEPSRLFIYYNERTIEGTVNQDSGAQIRDGIKSVASQGVCPESIWPYDISKFTNKPSDYAYSVASQNLVKQYLRLDNTDINQLKHCLANGYGFAFGFSVYESFESEEVAQTGKVSMPNGVERCLGGHAVFGLGYDDADKTFIIRNSWGEDWGDAGHFYLPYDYITSGDLADDFWTVRLV